MNAITQPVLARWFTRARLRRGEDGSAGALGALLAQAAQADHGHALVWSLFARTSDAPRDFLYRDMGDGSYLLLSARKPEDPHGLWGLECKEWAPDLREGDHLGFSLRANPTVDIRTGGRAQRSKRHDVVMHRRRTMDESGEARGDSEIAALREWLAARGERQGFVLDGDLRLGGSQQRRMPRPDASAIRFTAFDLDGRLRVTDPQAFQAALSAGIGKSRAFGCGLMLIRPV